jgi:hypothetical protein
MLDEEFDVLGEEDLALWSRRFEGLYTNRKNTRRSSGMFYRCGKHGHFITKCPEAMEVKPEDKHRTRTDHKRHSRDDYKGKNKSERSQEGVVVTRRRSERWWPLRATSTQAPATLHRAQVMKIKNWHKGKWSGKNINGLCFVAQGFCGMAHSSASKKSNKDDSSSDLKEEVNTDTSLLIAENSRLNDLLDNRDDVLKKTNKEKRKYRSLLGEAK